MKQVEWFGHHNNDALPNCSNPPQPSTTLYSPPQPSTALHNPLQPSTALHSPPQPSTALHSPPQPSTALHSPLQPSTALHSPLQPKILDNERKDDSNLLTQTEHESEAGPWVHSPAILWRLERATAIKWEAQPRANPSALGLAELQSLPLTHQCLRVWVHPPAPLRASQDRRVVGSQAVVGYTLNRPGQCPLDPALLCPGALYSRAPLPLSCSRVCGKT